MRTDLQRSTREPADQTPDERAHGTPSLVVETRLPPEDVARAGLVLLGLGVGAYLLWRLQEIVFLLLLAILLATAIAPIVNRLARGPFSRGAGILAVYTVIFLAIALPAFALAPSLVAQGAAFTENLPSNIEALRPYAEQLQPRPLQQAAVEGIDRLAAELSQTNALPGEQLLEAGATALRTVVNFLTVFVLAFYWLLERPGLKRALLRLVPSSRARDVNELWIEVEEKLGGWVRGQLILMLAMGVMAGIGFFLIGLPNPILLAVFAAVAEMIPVVGPFLAFAPAILVAITTGDLTLVLLTAVYSLIIQELEANVLVPRVMSRTVGISPLTVLLGILAGAALYGIPGALVAVPVAGAIQVILAYSLRHEEPASTAADTRQTTTGGATSTSPRHRWG